MATSTTGGSPVPSAPGFAVGLTGTAGLVSGVADPESVTAACVAIRARCYAYRRAAVR